MDMKTSVLAFLAAVSLALAGCASEPKAPRSQSVEEYISATYAAVDNLLGQVGRGSDGFNRSDPIIVATLVNIDELSESSRLGRSLSEQTASRMTQKGFRVIELKLRGDIFVRRDQGELLLSREIKDISLRHKAQAVVVGTYAVADKFVHVNLKMVSGDTQHALAATDYGLPMDENTRALVSRGR